MKTNDPEIDAVFAKQAEILPSSGFAASVMDAVRREASAPPPIPFPWKRALPGVVIGALVLGMVVVLGVAAIVQMSQGALFPRLAATPLPLSPSLWQGITGPTVAWTGLALLVAFVSVKISMRLAAGRV